MQSLQLVERVVNLLDPDANILLNVSYEDAVRRVAAADPRSIREIDGQFAILARWALIVTLRKTLAAAIATRSVSEELRRESAPTSLTLFEVAHFHRQVEKARHFDSEKVRNETCANNLTH